MLRAAWYLTRSVASESTLESPRAASPLANASRIRLSGTGSGGTGTPACQLQVLYREKSTAWSYSTAWMDDVSNRTIVRSVTGSPPFSKDSVRRGGALHFGRGRSNRRASRPRQQAPISATAASSWAPEERPRRGSIDRDVANSQRGLLSRGRMRYLSTHTWTPAGRARRSTRRSWPCPRPRTRSAS